MYERWHKIILLHFLLTKINKNMSKHKITVAYGDGIGPEIMEATLSILKAAEAPLEYEEIKIGKEVYLQGISSGIPDEAWESLKRNKVFLKAPITTPQGGGYKSLNVTIRKKLSLYANVRPVQAYVPYIASHFPTMNLVVVRENEEDLYAGIEHQQTSEVIQCLKLVSKQGSEKIIRYAFEYARQYGRKKVTAMTKDNIMKRTDGAFHKIFNDIALEYPEIVADHYIIDIGAAMLAARPDKFDVIVTLNLYGDIISDITAQVAGSVGLGGSFNIGNDFAMFEAIHGSAPDIAGKDIANPSGLLNGACMMLLHLGISDKAALIQNALLRTLEDGIHTGDIANDEFTVKRVGTQEFAQEIIKRLGQNPTKIPDVKYNEHIKPIRIQDPVIPRSDKKLIGVDVFIEWAEEGRNPEKLGKMIDDINVDGITLRVLSNKGVKVYPGIAEPIKYSDHWRCRFLHNDSSSTKDTTEIDPHDVARIMMAMIDRGFDVIKTENLYTFDGEIGFSLSQGE